MEISDFSFLDENHVEEIYLCIHIYNFVDY